MAELKVNPFNRNDIIEIIAEALESGRIKDRGTRLYEHFITLQKKSTQTFYYLKVITLDKEPIKSATELAGQSTLIKKWWSSSGYPNSYIGYITGGYGIYDFVIVSGKVIFYGCDYGDTKMLFPYSGMPLDVSGDFNDASTTDVVTEL